TEMRTLYEICLTTASLVGYTVARKPKSLIRSKVMADETTFGLSAIEQIAVNAHDIERAVGFYRDKLGMKLLFSVPPNLAFFDCDGIRLMLSLPAKPEFDHPSSVLYFNVDDIQQATQTLSARGVQFEEQPEFVADMVTYDLWLAAFRDSENNLLALMSHVPKKAS
ncbi:MAG: VOC family protein, partial [bacterium]